MKIMKIKEICGAVLCSLCFLNSECMKRPRGLTGEDRKIARAFGEVQGLLRNNPGNPAYVVERDGSTVPGEEISALVEQRNQRLRLLGFTDEHRRRVTEAAEAMILEDKANGPTPHARDLLADLTANILRNDTAFFLVVGATDEERLAWGQRLYGEAPAALGRGGSVALISDTLTPELRVPVPHLLIALIGTTDEILLWDRQFRPRKTRLSPLDLLYHELLHCDKALRDRADPDYCMFSEQARTDVLSALEDAYGCQRGELAWLVQSDMELAAIFGITGVTVGRGIPTLTRGPSENDRLRQKYKAVRIEHGVGIKLDKKAPSPQLLKAIKALAQISN
ncbi:MAG: hypothetical protein LBS14_01325 [Holosporaceae bacterium]|jgi:hypothetical protein|nr:hypothetical protein [Holosporaceae bacterium]